MKSTVLDEEQYEENIMAVLPPTSPAANATGASEITVTWTNGESYDNVYVEWSVGGGWTSYPILSGATTSKVANVIQNSQWSFRVRGAIDLVYSAYSAEVSATCHANTSTGTINISSSAAHSVALTNTVTGTINLSSSTSGAKTLKTDYLYYFGTKNGTTHIYSDTYKGDAGVIIPCQYITKDTDFTDQDQQSNDKWKTIYAIKVFYEDMSANTRMAVSISTDGGATWAASQAQTLGTGSEKRKDTTFFFIVSGQFFRFKIFNGSASNTFKWLGMEVEYGESGEHWVTA